MDWLRLQKLLERTDYYLLIKMVFFHGLKQVNTHSGTGSLLTHALFYILKTSEFLESLKKALSKNIFEIRINQNFRLTIENCANVKRPEQESTWIEKDMIQDYCKLHESGIAHSVEAYFENKLVGGLYGIFLGRSFFGESMFYKIPEASKACLAKLVEIAKEHNFHFIDCQVPTEHLRNMGACEVRRSKFLRELESSLKSDHKQIKWTEFL